MEYQQVMAPGERCDPWDSEGVEYECAAEADGYLLGMHCGPGKTEEHSVVQPAWEKPGPWGESVLDLSSMQPPGGGGAAQVELENFGGQMY